MSVSDIRGVVYKTKKTGLITEPWITPFMRCDSGEDKFLKWTGICLRDMTKTILVQLNEYQKQELRWEGSIKSSRKI